MSTLKSAITQTTRDIAKSAAIISIATFCSRILGFIRDVAIARMFGVYIYAQAFAIAFKIPNLFRDLVGEGAANAAIVPVLSEYNTKHTKEEFWELANILLNISLVLLMLITILGIIFSPYIVRLIAPGFLASPEKFSITVNLSRIIFPYILLVCLSAYSMGILNSLKHFTVPAFASCFLNISIIIFVLIFKEGVTGLALGILIGGLLQLGIQIPVLYRKGFRLTLAHRLRHKAVDKIGKLMLPRILSSSIYQLNNFVDSIFGSLSWIVGEGGVAILYFSYRLILFPLGIFSNALSQATLPTLSTQAAEKNLDQLKHTLLWSLRMSFFVLIPASLGLMILAHPIISTLFGGGRFDLYSVRVTSDALLFYSIGLFAYGATKILHSCFFALQDTKTPAKVAFLTLALNVLLNYALMYPLKIGGIALATSISGTITFFVLFAILNKKIGGIMTKEVFSSLLRISISSLFMAVICYIISQNNIILGSGIFIRFINLGLIISLSVFSYLFFCHIFKVQEMRELRRWIFKKK